MERQPGATDPRQVQYDQEREGFFDWLDRTAGINAEHNRGLTEAEILALIEQARDDVAAENSERKC